MFSRFVSLIAGLLFGLGMMISGMVDPNKVIGFLDVAGSWDPSLAFVMGGALLVFMPFYFLVIRKLDKPVCETDFHLSKNNQIDNKLITGAVLFGLGWGIAGICPGPAVTSLSGGDYTIVLFTISMLIGIWLGCKLTNVKPDAHETLANETIGN
ncbi:YeeE/YedE family protein [Photobacterium sp.]|uniref:YeeE/YedE family protein n=1 Tax=Photobacterium sp. TaxID=660 RepID=UPI00299E91A8|nr:YeeE/YedE family protein [Photobacterium sp.]MDX1300854.1 YeeE/YedE family protein [Photobacterium sp.]